jgi:hypothetical protein
MLYGYTKVPLRLHTVFGEPVFLGPLKKSGRGVGGLGQIPPGVTPHP